MAAPLILAEGLGKFYGGKRLFDDGSFQIEVGQKVAIVGPNGAGKSTLLRILAGRERPDHGTLRILPGTTCHWFDQHPNIPEGATVKELLASPLPPPAHLQAEFEELETRIADPALYEDNGYEAVLERYAAVQQEIRAVTRPPADAWNTPIVRDMGFRPEDLEQKAQSLSGGEKTRLFLARALGAVRPGDLVVLDEPTNHLDVDSIEWLEEWIQAFDGTVLCVAHDRAFLDNIAERVFEVTAGRITCFYGNYEDYVQARDEEVERRRRDHAKAEEKMQQAKDVILQFRQQKRFDGQYASRMKALEKYKAALDHTPDPVLEKLGFGLQFDSVEKSGVEVLRITGLEKSYGEQKVLKGAELELRKGDRVGLVGGNGEGKSTLLKLLTGRIQKDAGAIRVAPGAKSMFFSQEHDDLDVRRTLREEVLDARASLDDRDIKALLGRFRFNPEADMGRTVGTLSGGERQRMMLLKCILRPSNLLILDEPTNHLDLWARDVVIHALNAYHGTLLVVSHDRFLLDSCTASTAVLAGGQIQQFPGAFTETRHLHKAQKSTMGDGSPKDRYVVRKRFTDWTTNTKYNVGDAAHFSDAQVSGSVTLRNALQLGWIEKA
ncbi:MAG TPA: ABC-F family ATP-binding cassette domain-containing protein [Candidatus Thermoplasmatota archaeon]|nr:ABC-F family ATP-binding cassette domain-containing protein [Candidatus Thermoplasmatota archaeon]